VGEHDINITFSKMVDMVGRERAEKMRDATIAIYLRARAMAEEKGIIIADTKFEFGVRDGKIIVIDELLTPDSSRFWPREGYRPGISPESFDKQYVRDYLIESNWDPNNPPNLPPEVIRKTQEKYTEALRRLTSKA
jgi:phosphoribosylaminoimidazole-succinocarboxamide synthase